MHTSLRLAASQLVWTIASRSLRPLRGRVETGGTANRGTEQVLICALEPNRLNRFTKQQKNQSCPTLSVNYMILQYPYTCRIFVWQISK